MRIQERRLRILEHLGRYRLSIRPVLDRVFFNGGSSDNDLRLLVERGDIHARSRKNGTGAFASGHTYYQLTAQGVAKTAFPKERSKSLGPRALQTHLAVLWFCFMKGEQRERLESEHLKVYFGESFEPKRLHVYCDGGSGNRVRIYNVRLLQAGKDTDCIRAIKEDRAAARRHDQMALFVNQHAYRHAVLVHSRERKRGLEKSVRADAELRRAKAVNVEVVPCIETLDLALKEISR